MGKFSSANVFFSDDKKEKKKKENIDLFFPEERSEGCPGKLESAEKTKIIKKNKKQGGQRLLSFHCSL